MRYRYLPYTDKSGGDSPGQLICRLWYRIASQFLAQNIYLPSQTVTLVSNVYMVPVHVPYCRSKRKCRDSAKSRLDLRPQRAVGDISDPQNFLVAI